MMKVHPSSTSLVLLLLLATTTTVIGQNQLQELPFETRLDHFDPRSNVTVEFTYVQNIEFYEDAGPIYIFVNDPDVYTTEYLTSGLMYDIANRTRAALVTANNRFFRNNVPTQNASFENLQYLTYEQSVQDLARLIVTVKATLPNAWRSPVILWGTGMGATLATWTKQKFPHIVDGVWSSSGVFGHVVHTNNLYERLSHNIETVGGAECAANVGEAFLQISTLMVRGGSSRLSNSFRTCMGVLPFYDADVATFFVAIIQVLVDFASHNHATGIREFCTAMAEEGPPGIKDPQFEAYARWVTAKLPEDDCLDVSIFSGAYDGGRINWDYFWNTSPTVKTPSRSSWYLACTQSGMFSTTVNAISLFGHTIGQDVYHTFCSDIFGDDYSYGRLAGAVASLELRFGSRVPSVDGLLYTNGELDPAWDFGMTNVSGVDHLQSFVYNIPNHAKSADLKSHSADDDWELKVAKQYVEAVVTEWSIDIQ